MIRSLALGLLALLIAVGPLRAEAPPSVAPGMPVGTGLQPTAIYRPNGAIWDPGASGSGGSTVTGSQEQDVRSSGSLAAGTANAAITIPVNGQSTVGFAIAGLAASGATLTFEQSNDGGTTWTGINEVNAGTGVLSGTRTTDGQARISVSGRTAVRLRVSAAGTGTISVVWNVSVREGIMSLGSPLPPGSNALGSVSADLRVAGAANASGNPIFAQVTNPTGAGSVTAAGTGGSQAQAIQGINGGVPITTASAVVDGAASTYTVTATATQPGIPLAGYGALLAEANGGTATHVVQFSSDSTDGVNGTWTSGLGFLPGDAGGAAPAGSFDSSTNRRRLFRAQDGLWARLVTTAFTSGPVTVTLTRRVAPIAERAVFVGNSLSTTIRSAGTNRSLTIGTTAATAMAANTSRQGWKIKNDGGTGDVWINFDATATATPGGGNIKIPAGGYLASEPGFVETGAMSIIGSTAGLAVTIREH